MSSHGSDHITNEKHDTSPEIVSAAVPATHTPKVQGKEKTVHNAELFAAIQEANINPRSKESMHLYFSIFIAFCWYAAYDNAPVPRNFH
jgi:hypothetical protein